MAFEPDKRTGDYLFWHDTAASLRRLAIGLRIARCDRAVPGHRRSA